MEEKKPEYIIKAGYPVFTGCPADDGMIAEARALIEEKGLTADEVKIVRKLGCISVVLKKDWNGKVKLKEGTENG